jgi:hypothetical protein
VQGAQGPAGHRVRARDPDDPDGEERDQSLDQQLPRRLLDQLGLPQERVELLAVVQHDLGAGLELVRGVQGVADQQPGQQDQDRPGPDQQDAVEQGEPQAQGRTHPHPFAPAGVDGHTAPPAGRTTTGSGTR